MSTTLLDTVYYALKLDLEMHWHCEGNDHIWASYLSESVFVVVFCVVFAFQ